MLLLNPYRFISDPHFAAVRLLLHGNGANNGTVFFDSSADNRAATVTGGIVTQTDGLAFGASSIRCFSGDTANHIAYTATFAAAGESFTFEYYMQIVDQVGIGDGYAEGRGEFARVEKAAGARVHSANGMISGSTSQVFTLPSAVAVTHATAGMADGYQRVHVALTRSGGSATRLYVGGRYAAAGTEGGSIEKLIVGNRAASAGRTTGVKIEEMRWTQGVVRGNRSGYPA